MKRKTFGTERSAKPAADFSRIPMGRWGCDFVNTFWRPSIFRRRSAGVCRAAVMQATSLASHPAEPGSAVSVCAVSGPSH